MKSSLCVGLALLNAGGVPLLTIEIASANPIVPEINSTTQVSQTGNEFTITGGLTSGDGQTLFHGFEQFGLSAGQVATFLTNPDVQAILGRVSGGNASYIDGLLRVNSSADLYLINPAGILFGANAQLDLSGSFAATTAHGVLFGDDIFQSSDPSQFSGTPTGYLFGEETAAIVNAADLTVSSGESITLIGGQVVSTGRLAAPSGEITIAAIPAANLVRISHPDMVLNLELATLPEPVSSAIAFQPASLPDLLTGGDPIVATDVTVQSDGVITLVNTAIADSPGTTLVTGTVDVSGQTGGDVAVIGDRVGLVAATVNVNGEAGGGSIRIGGAYQGQPTLPGSTLTVVDGNSTLTASGGETGNGGRVILWSDSTTAFTGNIVAQGGVLGGDGGFVEVSGAETLTFQGAVDTTAAAGETGSLLLDPVDIRILNGTADGDDTGINANLLEDTNVTAGDAAPTMIYESELEGIAGNTNLTLQASNSITLENLADDALTFQTGTGSISLESGGAFTVEDTNDAIVAPRRNLSITASTITAGDLNTSDLFDLGGDVSLIAPGAISVGSVDTRGDSLLIAGDGSGNVTISGSRIQAGQIRAGGGFFNPSRVELTAANDIIVETISTGGGGLEVNAGGRFVAWGSFIATTNIALESPADDALIDFLMRGNPQPLIDAGLINMPLNRVTIMFPTSILVSPEAGGGGIIIRHGGQATTLNQGNILIQGSGANPTQQFVAGPNNDHTIAINPVTPTATFSGFSTLFPAGSFPNNASGTIGAILRGQGDSTLVTSFQNQLFVPLTADTTGLEQLSNQDETLELTPDDNSTVLEICEASRGSDDDVNAPCEPQDE